MRVKQKMLYMGFGCFVALAGYILVSFSNDSVAQRQGGGSGPDRLSAARSFTLYGSDGGYHIGNVIRWYTILTDHQAESITPGGIETGGGVKTGRVVWEASNVTFIFPSLASEYNEVCRIFDAWNHAKRGFPFEFKRGEKISKGIARPNR